MGSETSSRRQYGQDRSRQPAPTATAPATPTPTASAPVGPTPRSLATQPNATPNQSSAQAVRPAPATPHAARDAARAQGASATRALREVSAQLKERPTTMPGRRTKRSVASAPGASVKTVGIALAVFSSLCFGASGSLGKALIGGGFAPLQAVWLRMAGSALVLVPLALAMRGLGGLLGARRYWPWLFAYGLAGVAGCQALYFVAASRLPVGIAILLEFTGPVLVLAWTRLVRRTPVHPTAALGVMVALAGLAVVVQVWSGLRLDALGLLAGLGAAACQAAYFLLVERMEGVDPLVMTAAGSVVGTLLLAAAAAPWALPWHLLGDHVRLAGHSVPAWLPALWLIVVSTVIAYVTGVAAVQRLSAPAAGAICYAEAVFAPLLAWALLGERLTPIQITGGAIVLAGAFIAQRSIQPSPAPTPAPANGPSPALATEPA